MSAGSIYYSWSSEFDYAEYMEEKSHFDRIEIKLDKTSAKLIGTAKDLASEQMDIYQKNYEGLTRSIENVFMAIERGNEYLSSISIDTRDIRDNSFRMIDLLDWGFSTAIMQLEALSETLDELLKVNKSPDQTWALEQFTISRDLFKKGLTEEAYEYVSRAIDGYKDRSGYSVDARFYMLRGAIHLGEVMNPQISFIDLNKARANFVAAARYSKGEDNKINAKALGLVGWTYYCQGQSKEAVLFLKDAVVVDDSQGDIWFNLSKVAFHLKQAELGENSLRMALQLTPKLAIRAFTDTDFDDYRSNVMSIVETEREDLKKKIVNIINELQIWSYKENFSNFVRSAEYSNEIEIPQLNLIYKIRDSLDSLGLLDLVELCDSRVIEKLMHDAVKNGSTDVFEKIAKSSKKTMEQSLTTERRNAFSKDHSTRQSQLIVFFVVILSFVIAGWATSGVMLFFIAALLGVLALITISTWGANDGEHITRSRILAEQRKARYDKWCESFLDFLKKEKSRIESQLFRKNIL